MRTATLTVLVSLCIVLSTTGANASDQVYYFHNDHLGTPQAMSDASGRKVWEAEYDPFGMATVNDDPDGDGQIVINNLRFPGQYYDAETGLHYNYHRDYDQATGRYLTPDPIGLAGGLNLYAYAEGNPVMEVDPFGLESAPYHPPTGVKVKCLNTDTCPQLQGKMGEIMRMIKSHQGWDRNNPAPRGGGRHSQEIAELWNAYASCQSIYKGKKCDDDKCEEKKNDLVLVGAGGAYLFWKLIKTGGCTAVGGPAAGAACALTP